MFDVVAPRVGVETKKSKVKALKEMEIERSFLKDETPNQNQKTFPSFLKREGVRGGTRKIERFLVLDASEASAPRRRRWNHYERRAYGEVQNHHALRACEARNQSLRD